ncbi:MAG TPA: anti-sigma factor, partial [Chloroflexota bacterium]|nr:anti-sigma factor [Chloroflexota bacterium]
MTTLAHISDLAAGYAFGALDESERESVEAHLVTCQECAESVWEALEVAALLPFSVTPYRAPADLKQAVLEHLGARAANGPMEQIEEATTGALPRRSMMAVAVRKLAIPPWLGTLLLRSIPWTVAIASCVLVAFLLVYSHGQSDRIRTMGQDDQLLIASLTAQRNQAETIQQFLLTPGVTVLPLIYQAGQAQHTYVGLFEVPGYIHAVIGARGLAVLPKGMLYQVWAQQRQGAYVALGTLLTAGPLAEGASVIV